MSLLKYNRNSCRLKFPNFEANFAAFFPKARLQQLERFTNYWRLVLSKFNATKVYRAYNTKSLTHHVQRKDSSQESKNCKYSYHFANRPYYRCALITPNVTEQTPSQPGSDRILGIIPFISSFFLNHAGLQ